MLKTCRECKKSLAYDFFRVKGKTKKGAIKRDRVCKNCKSRVKSRFLDLYGDSGLKKCSSCSKELPWDEFSHRIQDGKRYLRSKCKECCSSSWNKWAELHPEYKDKKLLADRKAHEDYKKYHRLGLTKKQYLIMLDAQKGVCAICLRPPKDKQSLVIDHNHATEEVRGLLCRNCNRGIGLLGDSIQILENSLNYLRSRGSYG